MKHPYWQRGTHPGDGAQRFAARDAQGCADALQLILSLAYVLVVDGQCIAQNGLSVLYGISGGEEGMGGRGELGKKTFKDVRIAVLGGYEAHITYIDQHLLGSCSVPDGALALLNTALL